jgi:hypothetical protein
MFNWLKRKKTFLEKWTLGNIVDFEMIQNQDSVQYVSKDGTRVIYLSALNVSPGNILSMGTKVNELIIKENENGWQLNGTKQYANQILICVFSVGEKDDIVWAKEFYNLITPKI